jgi:hypothetical protein
VRQKVGLVVTPANVKGSTARPGTAEMHFANFATAALTFFHFYHGLPILAKTKQKKTTSK